MSHVCSPGASSELTCFKATGLGVATAAKGATSAGYRHASPADTARWRCFVRRACHAGFVKRLAGRSFIHVEHTRAAIHRGCRRDRVARHRETLKHSQNDQKSYVSPTILLRPSQPLPTPRASLTCVFHPRRIVRKSSARLSRTMGGEARWRGMGVLLPGRGRSLPRDA
jgi:hypothetical protein